MSGSENWNPLRSNYSSADLDLVHQTRSANYSITIMFNVACENRRFAGRNVCDPVTEIPYRWRKICPESGHKRWAFSRTNTILYQNRRGARRNGCFRRLCSMCVNNLLQPCAVAFHTTQDSFFVATRKGIRYSVHMAWVLTWLDIGISIKTIISPC